MTLDRLIDLAAFVNPGFFVMAAALVAAFARGIALRIAVLVGAPLVALATLLYAPAAGMDVLKASVMGYPLSLYRPDSLSLIFGFAFILAAGISGVYSLHRVDRVQDASSLVYAGATVCAAFAGDLISLFVFWELTALASAVLVFAGRTREASAAGMRYLVVQIISGLLLLAGVATYVAATGVTTFADMAAMRGGAATPPLVGLMSLDDPGAVLIFLALGIKAAFPLLHAWLQDAYPRASETGAVWLSAFTTKLAVYALARLFAGEDALIWIGAIMTVFPVFFAVIENDLRKVLAYSLNNQVGFMVCAVGIGSEMAINGAAAHAFAHILYKALLFMSMGAVLLRTGTTKATELGGLHRTMPFTTLFCLIGAMSISAVPLFSGFAAKSMTMSAAHGLGGMQAAAWFLLLFASAGVLEHSGIKIPYFGFFSHDSGKRPREAPFTMLLAMGIAAAISMSIGLDPGWLYRLLPYSDLAMEYLKQDLWTTGHVIEQLQLLTFALLAFLLLRWFGLYPAERPGVILDIDWLWRRAAPAAGAAFARPLGAIARIAQAGGTAAGRQIISAMRHVFAPGAWVSRKAPLAEGAVWTACLLAVVTVLSMFFR
jgi:multicomponent Na+:H+ antiporter subunit D